MVWNEFFLCHSLCKNFLYTGWVKILFLWVHNHMSSKFCFSLLTYLSSSPTTTVPELKSELLISTWTLLNHRCSAKATLWVWMPWIGTGLLRIWPLCLWLALSRPQIYLRLEPWVCFSDLSLWGLFLRSRACSNSSRWHHPASRVLLPPPYALRHTIYSLQYLYEN